MSLFIIINIKEQKHNEIIEIIEKIETNNSINQNDPKQQKFISCVSVL